MPLRNVVIVAAVRTPTGKFQGALHGFTAPELGAIVIREVVARAGIDASVVDECIMGNVVSAGLGQNPARQAALAGGLPHTVAAVTVNKVCGSGLKAVMLAAQGIAVGDTDVVVAGGMESMSRCPYLAPRVREGLRLGHGTLVDSMVSDGLWCAIEDCHMGATGDLVAARYGVSRAEQDAYALASHQKAAAATAAGAFRDEIVRVGISVRTGLSSWVEHDEPIRADSSLEKLASLPAAFVDGGTVTAGNAPGVSDGASALVLMSADRARALGIAPLARVVGQATSGVEPKLVLMAPVTAVTKLLDKVAWSLDDVDAIELNEAFAAQAVAVIRELRLAPARVNVNGGALALGHAIGSSGARVLTTLVHALRRHDWRRGIATLCLGGGNGVALAIERTR